MKTANRQDCRGALRAATSDLHAQVDAAFTRLDITHPRGLCAFLRAQADGLSICADALERQGRKAWADIVRRRVDAARFDLSALEAEPEPLPRPRPALVADEPLGVAYVVAGSLHGTAVLKRMWLDGADTPLFPEGFSPLFFDGSAWKPMWAEVLHDLRGVDSPAAAIASAQAAFGAFLAAAMRAEAGHQALACQVAETGS